MTGTMMNIATIHYIAQPDFISMSLFLSSFFLNSAKYFIQECICIGVLQTKKYFTKETANRKKRTNQTNKQKKRYKLYKKIAIDNKISPLREVNLSPTQGLIIFCQMLL